MRLLVQRDMAMMTMTIKDFFVELSWVMDRKGILKLYGQALCYVHWALKQVRCPSRI